jgi:hypothetical protein
MRREFWVLNLVGRLIGLRPSPQVRSRWRGLRESCCSLIPVVRIGQALAARRARFEAPAVTEGSSPNTWMNF